MGGVTPEGYISIEVFSTLPCVPHFLVHEVENGRLSREVSREVAATYVREGEANLLLNLNTAVALHTWLGERVAELQRLSIPFTPIKH